MSIKKELGKKGDILGAKKVQNPSIFFMALDRIDNSKFKATIANALKDLDKQGLKLSAINIAKQSGYPLKEIELNLFEVTQIMNGLGL